jgi:ribosome biogenesis GTPase A
MAKSQREIVDKLKLVDSVIELLDARIPFSSRNPMVDELVGNKPRLILLTKYDLADPAVVSRWIEYFQERGIRTLSISAMTGHGINKIFSELESLTAKKREREEKRGIKPQNIRTMIIGIPNVGKSALINRLVNKKVAKTGDRPGVTKGQQWIRIADGVDLLDTPGILWHKFDNEKIGYRLALTGAIKDELLHFDDLAIYLINYFMEYYPENIATRYNIDSSCDDAVQIIEKIAMKRGCLLSGGRPDFDRAAELIVRELRSGLIGQYCLETPEMIGEEENA